MTGEQQIKEKAKKIQEEFLQVVLAYFKTHKDRSFDPSDIRRADC